MAAGVRVEWEFDDAGSLKIAARTAAESRSHEWQSENGPGPAPFGAFF
jgi:hypothetical protein